MKRSTQSNTATATDLTAVPHSIEAEEAVLGSLMIDRAAIPRVTAFLQADDFYRTKNGTIFAGIRQLVERNEPADFVTLCDHLERTGKLEELGGASYLAGLANATPTSALAEQYGRIVVNKATCRRMVQAGQQIAAMGIEQPSDVDDMITRAEATLYELRRGRTSAKIISPEERAARAFERYQRSQAGERDGIPYGFRDIDRVTQGAQAGQLIIVAGRPSMGKTSLMLCVAESMALRGHVVLFCSAEMPEAQLTDRSIAGRVKISVRALEEGCFGEHLWAGISDALGDICGEPLSVYDDGEMTTSSIRSVATEVRSKVGLDVLVVDYLQLLHDGHGSSDNERVGYISRQLKAIARGLQVPLIVGSQLNRECEDRRNKKPQLSDLRDSGSLEQDADVVMLLFRASYYWRNEEEWRKAGQSGRYPGNITDVMIAKQRQGKRGIAVPLLFEETTMQFRDAEVHREAAHAGIA